MPFLNLFFEKFVNNEDIDSIRQDLYQDNFLIYLSTCIRLGKVDALNAVLSSKKDYPEDFSIDEFRFSHRDRGQMTPLALACYHGQIDVVRALVENYQVRIDRQVRGGNTALHLAAFALTTMAKDCRGKAQLECAKYLIRKGAHCLGDDIGVTFLDILKNHIEKKALFAPRNVYACWDIVKAWEIKHDVDTDIVKPSSGCNIL